MYICIKEHIEYFEGGLSSDPRDKKNEGVRYHTNKGVRYSTYNIINKHYKRKGSYLEFVDMPDSVYNKIITWFRTQTASQVNTRDSTLFYFYLNELWASGNLRIYKNNIKKNSSLEEVLKTKTKKYKRLCKKYPHYCKGWTNRNKAFEKLLKSIHNGN